MLNLSNSFEELFQMSKNDISQEKRIRHAYGKNDQWPTLSPVDIPGVHYSAYLIAGTNAEIPRSPTGFTFLS